MEKPLAKHMKSTERLARALTASDVYEWLVSKGYFPESYVLPPCFEVSNHPAFGKVYFRVRRGRFSPTWAEVVEVHFPKTELTDRTFGIIEPKIHSDIAHTFATNWDAYLDVLFSSKNCVSSYSFPVPMDDRSPGQVGKLRSGRMIYEYIEMAENDVAAISYRYKYLVRTDVKNFYPSVYTHSLAWALHGKEFAREHRTDYSLAGNRLDKLFQAGNDGCTNGVPIGPAVSDVAAELVLGAVDCALSELLRKHALDEAVSIVRFKDDYRILARREEDSRVALKLLQKALREYRLELNDEKTHLSSLPEGIFREWTVRYAAANPDPTTTYDYKRFVQVYRSVVRIDQDVPGTGIIDRFLADLTGRAYRLRLALSQSESKIVMSLLLTLANRRTKALPKVLALVDAILETPRGQSHAGEIEQHLSERIDELRQRELEHRYQLAWIIYFLRARGRRDLIKGRGPFSDPIVQATLTSRFVSFKDSTEFKLFTPVGQSLKQRPLLEYLDVFKPQ